LLSAYEHLVAAAADTSSSSSGTNGDGDPATAAAAAADAIAAMTLSNDSNEAARAEYNARLAAESVQHALGGVAATAIPQSQQQNGVPHAGLFTYSHASLLAQCAVDSFPRIMLPAYLPACLQNPV
jgi:hypothetical protein